MKKAKTTSKERKKRTKKKIVKRKKLLSSQVKEKTLTASSNQPSSLINPDPNITDCDGCLLDQEACLKRCLSDKEEINEDLLYQVLAVKKTRKQEIRTESLPSQEAVDTVSIPYNEQLSMPYTEVTHESDSVKKSSQLLRLMQVSRNLDTLKALKPELTTVLEPFLSQFKGLDIHKVTKIISPNYRERHDFIYIELVAHNLRVRAILDFRAPMNILSTRLVKKLKLAPDLDYDKEFRTAGTEEKRHCVPTHPYYCILVSWW
ncbi:hypothetical protein DSO57_1016976 [Entomophthora muscae]|uniref:Uncharacterized protein n=1 Tax=Entomophthora muscae TaxID=34485 RepID=A0ACC2URB9_9FUNG|nr:hypothetical protein DSO57_1016976 [Entomophthora muscae]